MTLYVKRFRANPFGWEVYFFTDRDGFTKFTARAGGESESSLASDAKDSLGYTTILVTSGKNNTNKTRVCLAVFDGLHSTLAHEAVHAANFILDRASVKTTYDNDEMLAYLVGFIVDQCAPHLAA